MNKKKLIAFIAFLSLAVGSVLFTNPYRLPIVFVFVPATCIVVSSYMAIRYILGRLHLPHNMARSFSVVAVIFMSVAAILMSLGQFTPRDFTLLFSFALIGLFYVDRMLYR